MDVSDGVVRVRLLRHRDGAAWDRLRRENAGWLNQWEATSPHPLQAQPTFGQYVREQKRAARRKEGYSLGVEVGGQLVGHVTVSSVMMGSLCGAAIGYWIGQRWAGHGYIPRAVALVGDYCFQELGLHRLEINIRPENAPSLRVAAKLGFRDEGLRQRYLHINGQWCDHRTFALTAEEIGDGLLARLQARELHGR